MAEGARHRAQSTDFLSRSRAKDREGLAQDTQGAKRRSPEIREGKEHRAEITRLLCQPADTAGKGRN